MEQNNDLAMGYVMGRDGNGCYGGYGGFGGFGGDWLAILVILAVLGGNGGWGFGGNGGNGFMNYELGKAATQADVAAGFNNSAVLNNLNDIKLGQQTGFAAVQQTLCQGFNGVDRAIGDCCCQTQRSIDAVRYDMERNKCDILQNQDRNTQRLFDYFVNKENQDLRDQVLTYKFRESQATQNAYLVDQLRPTARPAYLACNPYESAYGYGRTGYGNCGYNNGGCCNG